MLDQAKSIFFKLYHTIKGSIGYYPTLIALLLSGAVLLLLRIENPELTRYIKEKIGFLIIDNADTARAILSTLIGGIISLTVFSFSMVMILLNQASSNFSPRLLPGLISNKPHQIVLGFYIGSILFNIICLINVLPGDDPFQIPSFTILIGILLGPVCLALFVFFIHSISQAIQIDFILEHLYEDTSYALDQLAEKIKNNAPSDETEFEQEEWFAIENEQYGLLAKVSEPELVTLATEKDTVFSIKHPIGTTILPGSTLLYSSKKLEESARKTALLSLHFSTQEVVEDNHLFGFKQLSEIIVRAMSPGINDPGTAIAAFDYLMALLAKRMEFGNNLSITDEENKARLHFGTVAFEDLVYYSFAALRTYVAHDPVLVSKMLGGINYLLTLSKIKTSYKKVLLAEQKALWLDAQKQIKNTHDLARLKILMDNT